MNEQPAAGLELPPDAARQRLATRSRLHWFHWTVVGLSFLLTLFAWRYARSNLRQRSRERFDQEADRVLQLVVERMQKYEQALWGGVAFIETWGGDIEYEAWREYAQRINVPQKYPGINGLGVIHALTVGELEAYLVRQRRTRPEFHVHPSHGQDVLLPISYIIPVPGNEEAVGLDIAHEENRLQAAQQARDQEAAQITGPITLVQDAGRTPGFLFYAPFYRDKQFMGLVYAPFVVRKLMEGTLNRENRHVGIRILDKNQLLYDEHRPGEQDYDPQPQWTRTESLPLYGREWDFQIRSSLSFRQASFDPQPATILCGGIFIDLILLGFFIGMSRTAQKSLSYADAMTGELERNATALQASERELQVRAERLAKSNEELEQFAYVASHDLQEPLRKISSYCEILRADYGDALDEQALGYLDIAIRGGDRLSQLVEDLLRYSRVTSRGKPLTETDTQECLQTAIDGLELAIAESHALVTHDSLPSVIAETGQLAQLFQNLLGNALKYRSQAVPVIHVGCSLDGQLAQLYVRDNGIGIDREYHDQIFKVFRRLHAPGEYAGTGIGLALCKRIVERFGGQLWVTSVVGQGSTFWFTLPLAGERHEQQRDPAATDSTT